MNTFYGISSGSVSTLFSGLSNSSNNGMSSGVNNASSMISDYYSIRNGSYKKLLTAYYDKYGKDEKTSNSISNSISTSIDSSTQLAEVKKDSGKLQESTTNLLSKGSASLFKETDIKDEDGNVTKGIDMDKIYKGIKDFADNYNETIKTAGKSNADSISRQAASMQTTTKANQNLLKSVGITINSDNSLSVNEDKLKKSDVSTLKSIFNTTGSYGYYIGVKASEMKASAAFEASKTNTYTNSGAYTSSLSSGNLYDSLF